MKLAVAGETILCGGETLAEELPLKNRAVLLCQ